MRKTGLIMGYIGMLLVFFVGGVFDGGLGVLVSSKFWVVILGVVLVYWSGCIEGALS